jgi:hypothetical protein
LIAFGRLSSFDFESCFVLQSSAPPPQSISLASSEPRNVPQRLVSASATYSDAAANRAAKGSDVVGLDHAGDGVDFDHLRPLDGVEDASLARAISVLERFMRLVST